MALAAVAIVLLGVAIYWGTLEAPFAFDDFRNIVENPAIRWTRLDPSHLVAALSDGPSARPVAKVSFALNYYLGGYEVRGYHVVNIAVHLLNALLVAELARITARRIGDWKRPHDPWIALFSGIVFVAHPLQTGSVTYIVQRMNSLAALFCLVALLLYARGRTASTRGRRRLAWTLALASWGLALSSKQNAMMLPFAVWFYEWYFFRALDARWARRHLLLPVGGALALSLLLYAYTNGFQGYAMRDFTLEERVLTQLRVVCLYLGLIVLPRPSRLNLLHEVRVSRSPIDPITTLLSAIALLLLLVVAVRIARRHPLASFGIVWFFVFLSLESSVLPLELVYEHRTYLPMAGVALLVGGSLVPWLGRFGGGALLAAAIAMGGALGGATIERNVVWGNEVALWSDVVAKSPVSPRARNALGLALARRSDLDGAILRYEQAIRLDRDYVPARVNLGAALAAQGRHEEAIAQYEAALGVDPENPRALHDLGLVFLEQGWLDEALRRFSESARLAPDRASVHNALGGVRLRQERFAEALRHYTEARRLDPGDPVAAAGLGLALARTGEPARAVAQLAEALRLRPEAREVARELAWILASSPGAGVRDGERAVRVAEAALRGDRQPEPALLDALAAGHAASGRFDAALRVAQRAEELADARDDRALRDAIRERIARYRLGRPYLQPATGGRE